MMKKWLSVFFVVFLLLAAGSALAEEAAVEPAAEPVEENPELAVLVNGETISGTMEIDISRVQTVQLTPNKPVAWTRSSRRRCEIGEDNLLTVLDTGGFTVTARDEDGKRVTLSFRAVRRALSIDITGDAAMTSRQTVRLKAAMAPSNATNRRITWSSSDPSVATVNSSGRVKAMPVNEVRTVVITAAAQDGSGVVAEHTITVYPLASSVTIYLDGQPVNDQTLDIDLAAFNSLRLTAAVFPEAASQNISWRSSSNHTARVSGGLVEALRKGTITLTVTAEDGSRVRARCKVRISVLSKGVTITGPNVVTAGKSISLKATVQPSNVGDRHVNWSSSDPSVATVTSWGSVRAGQVTESRQVTITANARDGASSGSYVVTVVPLARGVSIVKDGASVPNALFMNSAALGSTMKLSASVYPADAAQGVRWSSSSARVVSVDQDGTITCRGKGKALITARTLDASRVSCNIYVVVGDFSEMPYYIEVDKANQVVRVYERGDGSYTHLIRRMICSTGHWNTRFNNGLYNMNGARMEWCLAADHVLYMQYATRIHGSYMFHGVPTQGRAPDRVKVDYYNKLGTKASGGCIRLLCADAKWIYENVPNGTYVHVMDGVRNPAEYGAVSAPPIQGTWDPTDDNPANPYYDATYTSEVG